MFLKFAPSFPRVLGTGDTLEMPLKTTINRNGIYRGYHEAATPASPWLIKNVRVSNMPILVVGALSLNVARLLALVANLLASSRLLGAVARVMARLAAVVALHAVDALP